MSFYKTFMKCVENHYVGYKLVDNFLSHSSKTFFFTKRKQTI